MAQSEMLDLSGPFNPVLDLHPCIKLIPWSCRPVAHSAGHHILAQVLCPSPPHIQRPHRAAQSGDPTCSAHLCMVLGPVLTLSTPTELQLRPTRPPVSSPSVAAKRRLGE